MSNHRRTRIVEAEPASGYIASSRQNRDLPARQKIEETILNLATALGHKIIRRITVRDGTTMYSVDGGIFQRGANAILELSRLVLAR
jgi:hypothetical protein